MSLLNEVLQDLDRRTAPAERPAVRLAASSPVTDRPAEIEPTRTSPRWRRALWALIVAAIMATVAVYVADYGIPLPARPAAVTSVVKPSEASPVAAAHTTPSALPDTAIPAPSVAGDMPLAADATPATAEPANTLPAPTAPTVQTPPAAATQPIAAATAEPATLATVDYLPLRNAVEPPPRPTRPRASPRRADGQAAVKTSVPRVADPLAAAHEALAGGELAAAEVLLAKRLKQAPNDLNARELLLGLMLRGERVDAALEQLAQGLRHHPGHAKFTLIKARLLAQIGDVGGAIGLLQAAPPAGGVRREWLQLLAGLYQRQTRHDLAAETYRSLLAVAPGSGTAWAGLALSLDGLGDPEAAAAYRRALELGGLPEAADRYARQRLAELGLTDG